METNSDGVKRAVGPVPRSVEIGQTRRYLRWRRDESYSHYQAVSKVWAGFNPRPILNASLVL
jgi:hypothetical protein